MRVRPRCAVVAVPAESADADDLLLAAMDAGAEDVLEPAADDADPNDIPRCVSLPLPSDLGGLYRGNLY